MPANYSDPNQLGSWISNALTNAGSVRYLTPEIISQYRSMLDPYFQSQRGAFLGDFQNRYGADRSQAGMQSGALAAQRGLNPQAFMQSAQRGIQERYIPQYFQGVNQMGQNQLGTLLNTATQGQQFAYGQQMDIAKILASMYGANVSGEESPSLWGPAIGGLLSAGGAIGAALIA